MGRDGLIELLILVDLVAFGCCSGTKGDGEGSGNRGTVEGKTSEQDLKFGISYPDVARDLSNFSVKRLAPAQ